MDGRKLTGRERAKAMEALLLFLAQGVPLSQAAVEAEVSTETAKRVLRETSEEYARMRAHMGN